jgi:deoxyribodipyrimidine photo-lyase
VFHGHTNNVNEKKSLWQMNEKMKTTILWFNRDLRLRDNCALMAAICSGHPIMPLFVLDEKNISLGAAQRWWLHQSLIQLDRDLSKLGSRLVLRRGEVVEVLKLLAKETDIDQILWNRNYTPEAMVQEADIQSYAHQNHIKAVCHKGYLLFEPDEIKTLNGKPFSVYTPFWNALQKHKVEKPIAKPSNLLACLDIQSDALSDWGLIAHGWSDKFDDVWQVGEQAARDKLEKFLDEDIETYDVGRNIPGLQATSMLSPYLHFGQISPRDLWHQVVQQREMSQSAKSEGYTTFLKEVVWREFCSHLLFHNPQILDKNFRSEFDGFPWLENQDHLMAWQKGLTGYPIIDAGMRQLWATGWMHNRVRMIVASFLTKNLLIDWRDGERWFWDTLLDADQASNSVNWQWVAGSGADAAPYFRIFNPTLQSEKFDPHGNYIRQWVPELRQLSDKNIHAPYDLDPWALSLAGIELGVTYPSPIVDLKATRTRALAVYKLWF